MDEREANWGLNPIEEDETEVTEKLQIFVGLPQKESNVEWDISEDDDPFWDDDDAPLDEVPSTNGIDIESSRDQCDARGKGNHTNLPPWDFLATDSRNP